MSKMQRGRTPTTCARSAACASGDALIGARATTNRRAYAHAMSVTPSAQFSLTIRVEIAHRPGMLGQVATAIGRAGGTIGAVDLVEVSEDKLLRDITVDAADQEQWDAITGALEALDGVRVVDTTDRTFLLHVGGKIEQRNKSPLKTRGDLSMAYTPGVARVCTAIAQDRDKAFQYTIKRNTVAVVSDGTAVLGLGDIGPEAAMPVMEGKAMLFKEFAGVDAFPICLDTKDADEIVETVERIAPGFGGINLEDISAPRCFEIEDRLKADLDIPVFHDDQHGTAVVTLAALINACKLTGRELADVRVLVTGLGAAGVAVTKILMEAGVSDIVGADSKGLVSIERADYADGSMNAVKRWYAEHTNPDNLSGPPAGALEGRDLFIGLSGARIFPAAELQKMNEDAMVFAMANPTPEVSPEEAAPYARIVATGRSDYPNQINNVLCFPGIFRGALDVRAPAITEEMKMAAARAIARIIPAEELREDYIIPSVFNRDVSPAVAAAVAGQAKLQGTAQVTGDTIGFAVIDAERMRAG
jgi:malate dehydrogenase (oxaloacetate-decarboxylating)